MYFFKNSTVFLALTFSSLSAFGRTVHLAEIYCKDKSKNKIYAITQTSVTGISLIDGSTSEIDGRVFIRMSLADGYQIGQQSPIVPATLKVFRGTIDESTTVDDLRQMKEKEEPLQGYPVNGTMASVRAGRGAVDINFVHSESGEVYDKDRNIIGVNTGSLDLAQEYLIRDDELTNGGARLTCFEPTTISIELEEEN